MKSLLCVEKKRGETPLEALERVRGLAGIDDSVPMTYAGRLDPLASGLLLLLVGEECKNKERYLGLDKTYEFEVLYGVGTDTGDALGEIKASTSISDVSALETRMQSSAACEQLIGTSTQTYPLYSSKTVDGKPLFAYAREGLAVDIPTREITISSLVSSGTSIKTTEEIVKKTLEDIAMVKGDFRQEVIARTWQEWAHQHPGRKWVCVAYRAEASSGAYIRVVAEKLGELATLPALAWRIHRTKIGAYTLQDIDF
jgi:tRNA pseudouridine(55) synthase